MSGKQSTDKKAKWNEAYEDADIASALPASVLAKNTFLLPESGMALDLACGRAGNAQFLAKKGFDVDAVDNSEAVLKYLSTFISKNELTVTPLLRDIETEGLAVKQYDVIVVSYFLYRDLFPEIISKLKPNGLLFYQTWSVACEGLEVAGPKSQQFRLQEGELLSLCSPLQTLFYTENKSLGDTTHGLRNEAMIIAQKSLL
jgi:SAM-dependent methyltransferase